MPSVPHSAALSASIASGSSPGFIGFHHDVHAVADDHELGDGLTVAGLTRALGRMRPDFAQCDCKGHPGYTSWPSVTPGAAVPAGLRHDPLAIWRKATRKLGIPLHAHYSGIWDDAQATRHPDWAVVGSDGKPSGQKMCPRSEYLTELLIPQLREAAARYTLDGVWLDGDLWAVDPCYCPRCRAAWRAEVGEAVPPAAPGEDGWARWMAFHRDAFHAFAHTYVAALKETNPGLRVCSNWLQTFCDPGEPTVPTDWISGDVANAFGQDLARVEARFISTRGKPWDIMLWAFYFIRWHDPTAVNCLKSADQLMQEAAHVLAQGGSLQFYDSLSFTRDGRLAERHLDRLAEVVAWARRRRPWCQGAETVPQVAILHSEAHLRATFSGRNQMWDIDAAPVRAATHACLENHYSVDVLDEWALRPRLANYPVVVVPERHALSAEMVVALRDYVEAGGRLFITGAATSRRWDDAWLGIVELGEDTSVGRYAPLADGREEAPLWSERWRRVRPRPRATGVGGLAVHAAADGPDPDLGACAVLRRAGHGRVLTVPCDLFRDHERNQHPPTRRLIGELLAALDGPWRRARLTAPSYVDLVLRRSGRRLIAHLINRNTGLPNHPGRAAADDVPPLGPITLRLRCARAPKAVRLVGERAGFKWSWARGWAVCRIERLLIHAAVVVTEG